jgi:hypothetical protein
MFSRPREGAQFHPAGIIFSTLGAILVCLLQAEDTAALRAHFLFKKARERKPFATAVRSQRSEGWSHFEVQHEKGITK